MNLTLYHDLGGYFPDLWFKGHVTSIVNFLFLWVTLLWSIWFPSANWYTGPCRESSADAEESSEKHPFPSCSTSSSHCPCFVFGIALELVLFVLQWNSRPMDIWRRKEREQGYICVAVRLHIFYYCILVTTRIFQEMDNKCRVRNEVGEENRIKWKGTWCSDHAVISMAGKNQANICSHSICGITQLNVHKLSMQLTNGSAFFLFLRLFMGQGFLH